MVCRGESRHVLQRHHKALPRNLYRGLRQERHFHLRKHAGDALALVPRLAQVNEDAHNARIAAHVKPLQPQHILQRDARRQCPGADHFHAVLKQPHLHARALDPVVAVQDGVEDRLTPGKIRILRNLAKAVAKQAGRAAQEAAHHILRCGKYGGQVALDAGQLFHVVGGTGAALGTDHTKHTNAAVGMIGLPARKQKLGRAAEHDARAVPVGQLALQQVVFVCQRREPRQLPRPGKEFGIQISQGARRGPVFPALVHTLPFGFRNPAFLGLDRLIPDAKRKAVALHLNRHVTGRHVEDDHFVALVHNYKPLGLRRVQANGRCAQQRCQRFRRQVVACDGTVVLDAE